MVQGLVDVGGMVVVVKECIRTTEAALEEVPGESFLENVQAERASVEGDPGVGRAGRWNSRGAEQFGTEDFVQAGRVVPSVAELEAGQSVEGSPGLEPLEVEGPGGFIIEGLEGARALQSNGHVRECEAGGAEGGVGVGPGMIPEAGGCGG